MGLQEFPSKPVNKGGVVIGTINGPTEVAVGAQDSYLVADSTTTPGTKWQTYRQYYAVALTSGTSWTVPATVTAVDVIVIGGGGGSTGRSSSATANSASTGQPGGGGAIIWQKNYPTTPGASIPISIGAGGSGGTNPAPTASTDNYGGAAGNTTFGAIVAPGSRNKIGTRNSYVIPQDTIRGAFDLIPMTDSSPNTTLTSSTFQDFAGMPFNPDSAVWGYVPYNSSSAYDFSLPALFFDGSNTSLNKRIYFGIPNLFSKLTSLLTPPTGGTATQELVASTQLSGWGAFGGYARTGTVGSTTYPTFHGGGQGASINTTTTGTNRTFAGGAGAANSGSGAGAAAVVPGTTTVVGVAGSAGGSGVILVGYWA